MKKLLFVLLILTSSCSVTIKQIGKVNMISNRNVDPKLGYEVISSYSGGSTKEVKKSKATTVEDAIDQTVRKIPGGEFVMNAKIYLVDGQYLAVEGDVWGVKGNIAYRGFKIGDKVSWKVKNKFLTGVITSLKDDKTCLIKSDETSEIIEKEYDEITKN